jgi:hypothetical protein
MGSHREWVRLAARLSGSIPQRRVYTHTGWRKVNGSWIYLHGGGALGPGGPVDGIEVQLPEQLQRIVLPAVNDEILRDAVEASLALRNVAPDRVTIPGLGAVFRAPLGNADFSAHISGFTGVLKTEFASLLQRHFGAEMDSRSLPCNWESTANQLEAIGFAAKDAIVTIDDYVLPAGGTVTDRARLNAKADRLLRAQGNRSGRGRMRSDTTLRAARPPRGLFLSTGEEVPGGQSLRSRIIVIQVQLGDVDVDLLTLAQQQAADGVYAHAMAGFIKWLAPRLDEIRTDLGVISRERRRNVDIAHAGTADRLAQLYAAWVIWLRFAVDVGAVEPKEAEAIKDEVWATLKELAAEQQALQREHDPIDRFYALLGSVVSSGKGHLASAVSLDHRLPGADAKVANAMGWRRYTDDTWHPLGPRIGWWADDGIYLEPDASYSAAQQASSSGEGIGVTSTTLWRRMFERKLLLSTERRGGAQHFKARKSVAGKRQQVIHIAHRALYHPDRGPSSPADPPDQFYQADQEIA